MRNSVSSLSQLISHLNNLAKSLAALHKRRSNISTEIKQLLDCVLATNIKIALDSQEFKDFDSARRVLNSQLKRQVESSAEELLKDDSVLCMLSESLVSVYLDELFASGQPIKEVLRSVEDKGTRKILNQLFRLRREQHILSIIASYEVGWTGSKAVQSVGVGIDERIIEFPLAFEVADFQRSGKVLDAGAALNLPYIRESIGEPKARVIHFTQSGEKEMCSFRGQSFSYLFGDLRQTDFQDDTFDRILCISTLEHVGMDNSRYGDDDSDEGGSTLGVALPDGSHLDAVAEMLRILAPDGQMVITVPYGEAKSHGWYQIFDRDGIVKILDLCKDYDVLEKYYYYHNGWHEGGIEPPVNIEKVKPDVSGLCALRIVKLVK